ncbi:hypothetical protein PMKS-000282 [Pichia membranifaciens]|uniref:Uncharacterized protein n=1 Tax=Pichia membranifaciens TaxID=4926 RepID=A0A1Q2YB95_9ASCO|nr:hypothetical protein PMKS-000282 [Pichia membranifaciens]
MEQAISWGHYTREVMVLHNNKWKYKAKRNYERKHAIKSANKNSTKERTGDGSADNDGGSDGGSYNEGFGSDSSLASGDEDAGSDGGLKRRSKKNAKSSNSWRFEDPIVDETILKDLEYIARLEAIKAEEENRAAYMRNLVNDKLKNHEEAGEVDLDNKYSILKEIKSMKKFKQTDIQNWRFDDNLSDRTRKVPSSPEEDKPPERRGQNTQSHGPAEQQNKAREGKGARATLKDGGRQVQSSGGQKLAQRSRQDRYPGTRQPRADNDWSELYNTRAGRTPQHRAQQVRSRHYAAKHKWDRKVRKCRKEHCRQHWDNRCEKGPSGAGNRRVGRLP